jgi:hypothetical protein
MCAYSLHLYKSLLGFFHVYRRSFSYKDTLIRSVYEIAWNAQRSCLTFEEKQDFHSPQLQKGFDYSQSGDIFISNTIGLVHLLTKFSGALRLITLKQLDPERVTLGGIVLTQAQAPYYRPSASAIYFRKIAASDATNTYQKAAKVIDASDPEYEDANVSLIEVERVVDSFAFSPFALPKTD